MSQPPFQPPPGSPEQNPTYPPPPPPAPPGAGFPPPDAGQPQPGAPVPPGMGFPPPGAAVPPPPKKSNVGKIILISLAVVLLLCLGGGVATYFALKDDVEEVVDASQTRLVTPETLAGRPKITDPELQSVADQMITGLKADLPGATSTVGAFYGDPQKEDMVMIAGASALVANPGTQLDEAIKGMGTGGLTITNVTAVEPGPLGGEAKCGDADAGGVKMGVCVWADRGSLGVIGMYFKTAEQAKAEFVTIRGQVEQRS